MRYSGHGFLVVVLIVVLNGCTIEPVKPWERELLAEKKMRLDADPVDAYLDEHIYFSKESSSGGAGIGGGGCGCN